MKKFTRDRKGCTLSPDGARVLSRGKENLIKGTRHSLAPARGNNIKLNNER